MNKKIYYNKSLKIDKIDKKYDELLKLLPKYKLNKILYKNHIGGNIFTNTMQILSPLGKNNLVAMIILLVLYSFKNYKIKPQTGGFITHTILKTMAPTTSGGYNMLLVVLTLLLMDYFSNRKKNNIDHHLVNILQNKNIKNKTQKGGYSSPIWNNLLNILMPMGATSFSTTTLLLILYEYFHEISYSKKSKLRNHKNGTNLIDYINDLLKPLKLHDMYGGTDHNINHNILSQFGCDIPEWGYNLKVPHQGYCI